MSARGIRVLIAVINAIGFGWIALAENRPGTKPPETQFSTAALGTDDQTFQPDKEYVSGENATALDFSDTKKETPPPTRKPQSNPENPTE